jgi:NAD+ kinase
MLLPDSMELRICVPYNSRSTAWASFDGRGRVELKRAYPPITSTDSAEGDHIKVTASKYPFPTVCADKASTDWFSSISRTLRWNEREKQKSFVVVEEENEPVDKRRAKKKVQIKPDYAEVKQNGPDAIKEVKEFHDDEDSEEEEEYDIDE